MGTPSPNLYPDPAYGKVRWAWETIPGVAPVAGWHDVDYSGEKMGANHSVLVRTLITGAGEQPSPMDGKIDNGPYEGPKVDAFNPESDWWFLAAFFGKAAAPVTLEASGGGLPAAYMHRLSQGQTAVSFPPTFSALAWRDDNMADRKVFGRLGVLAFNFAEKALIGFTPTVVFARNDYLDDPVRTAGTGTAFPTLRGGYAAQWGADATQNLGFQLSAQDATTITAKAKLGDADTYAGGPVVYTRGVWTVVLDETGAPIGLPGQPLEVYWPVAGTFAATDVFTVARRRLLWPQTLPTRMAVNEVLSTIAIDGVDAEVKTGAMTMTRGTTEAPHGFGGRHGRRTRSRGERTYAGTLAREYLDTSFLSRLERGAPFTWQTVFDTGVPIGASGVRTYQVKFIAKNCKMAGAAPTVTDNKTLDESVTFSCHPSSDGTYPDALTAEVVNDIPDLAAA